MLAALGRHPMRPAHIHFIIGAAGFETVTTDIFVEGDPYLDSDAVLGVKDSLIVPFAARRRRGNPFFTAMYDFTLVRAHER